MTHRRIEVFEPEKSREVYRFRYHITRPPAGLSAAGARARRFLMERVSPTVDRREFGFVATNFAIAHSSFWDTAYPLMHLTRQGGPLLDQGCDAARIVLRFAFDPAISNFFVHRAARFGIDLEVDGMTAIRADVRSPTCDSTLAFGGGKDSRLLLGLLREFDTNPAPFQSGFPIGFDIADLKVTEPVSLGLADHVMPALMCAGQAFFFGSGLGEAHLSEPWHRHYDFGSPTALDELGTLCSSYGPVLRCQAPLSLLPYNLIQRILADRFPRLAKFQQSVEPNEESEKNLHVSLCKLYHGLDIKDNASPAVLRSLLDKFIEHQLANPNDFGFRDYRLPIRLEMRALLDRLRDHELIHHAASRIPESWAGDWIDHVHRYVDPHVDRQFLDVFHEYADDLPEGGYRIPV